MNAIPISCRQNRVCFMRRIVRVRIDVARIGLFYWIAILEIVSTYSTKNNEVDF